MRGPLVSLWMAAPCVAGVISVKYRFTPAIRPTPTGSAPRQAPPTDPFASERQRNGKKEERNGTGKVSRRSIGRKGSRLFLCPFRTRVDDCASLVIGERWRGGHQLSTYSVQSVASLPVSWSHSRWSVGHLNLRQRNFKFQVKRLCSATQLVHLLERFLWHFGTLCEVKPWMAGSNVTMTNPLGIRPLLGGYPFQGTFLGRSFKSPFNHIRSPRSLKC